MKITKTKLVEIIREELMSERNWGNTLPILVNVQELLGQWEPVDDGDLKLKKEIDWQIRKAARYESMAFER